MAKPENVGKDEGLLGGLSFGLSNQIAQEAPATRPAPVTPTAPVTDAAQVLTQGYKNGKAEKRNVKLNVLIKPSTARLLDKAVQRKEIKSKNDLINYLLEQYLGV